MNALLHSSWTSERDEHYKHSFHLVLELLPEKLPFAVIISKPVHPFQKCYPPLWCTIKCGCVRMCVCVPILKRAVAAGPSASPLYRAMTVTMYSVSGLRFPRVWDSLSPLSSTVSTSLPERDTGKKTLSRQKESEKSKCASISWDLDADLWKGPKQLYILWPLSLHSSGLEHCCLRWSRRRAAALPLNALQTQANTQKELCILTCTL